MSIREANRVAQNSIREANTPAEVGQQAIKQYGVATGNKIQGDVESSIKSNVATGVQTLITDPVTVLATAATAAYEGVTGDVSGTLAVMDTSDKVDKTLAEFAGQEGKEPVATGANQLARSVIAGVPAASAEIVAGAKTVYAALTDDKALRDSVEADRNTTIDTLDNWRNSKDSGIIDNLTYSLSKYMAIPGGAAAAVGKIGLGALGAAATVASTTSIISGQETKQDLMRKGVNRDVANTAGIEMGLGMGVMSLIPVAGLGSIKNATTGVLKVGAAATVGTAAMSSAQYATGVHLKNQGYAKEGQEFINMSVDPMNLGIGMLMGLGFGGVAGYAKYSQHIADMATLKAQSTPRVFTPEELKEAKDNGMGARDMPSIEQAKSILIDSGVLVPTEAEINIKHADMIDLYTKENNSEVETYFKFKEVQDASYETLESGGLLTTSDRNVIMNNERLIQEYMNGDIDRVELENGLEIPQVHRDLYLMQNYEMNGMDTVKEIYFGIDSLNMAKDEGRTIPPRHMSNVANRPIGAADKKPNLLLRVMGKGKTDIKSNLMDTIASGEGNYNSYNKGKAGDSRDPLPISSYTLGEIMRRQASTEADKLFAVGRYQIIPSTMIEAMKALKLPLDTKFTPEVQDMIFRSFLLKKKRPQVYDYVTGKNDNLEGAQLAVSQEFASVGIPRNVAGKTKDSSYYGDVGNNKASISSDKVGVLLQEQRQRYAAFIKEGRSEIEAWELSFKGDTLTGASVSAAVKEAKGVRSIDSEGRVYEDEYTRLSIREKDDSGNDITVPKRSIWSNIRDGFMGNQSVYDRVLGDKLYSEPYTGDPNVDAEIRARVEASRPSAETKAIQAAFEEVSYQHAVEARQQAIDNGFTPEEASNIMQNTFKVHQANLKIGQSKIFNAEYTKAISRGMSDAEAISVAYSNTSTRLVTMATLGNARITQDTSAPKEEGIIRVGDEEYKVSRGEGKPEQTEQKRQDTEEGITKTRDINTKRGDEEVITRITEMSTRIAGNDRIVNITPSGNRSFKGNIAAVDTVIDRSTADITIEGKTYTKEEARALLQEQQPIKIDEFITCALS